MYLYATVLLSLGLIWHGFHDTIREGDGKRILKFLLVLFKCTNHRNYAKEAVNLLIQHQYTFSERKVKLLWIRCVNKGQAFLRSTHEPAAQVYHQRHGS